MSSNAEKHKPHVVCVPYPAQGHVNPMLNLAKLLHYNNFHITFVNTEYNHRRLLDSRGPNALDGLPDFQFRTIPDGLPPSDANATQDFRSLCNSTSKHCLDPFVDLLSQLSSNLDLPPVTCIVSDGIMSFTIDAADRFGIPNVMFWTTSACGVLGYARYRTLLEKGLTPLKDQSYLTNGYLETIIDWIPEMKNIRLKNLPAFFRTTDRNDIMLNFFLREIDRTKRASAIILNTYDALEHNVLGALSLTFPPIYTIGPLQLLLDQIQQPHLENISSNLWKEQSECIEWLDSKEPNSVLYINFGSVTVITAEKMTELAWGIANSKKSFLWIIRPDLVAGENTVLPPEFVLETKDRGMMASWCKQEEVLRHPAVGGFVSHVGWNSMLESISGGVPMVCCPFSAEQVTNSWFGCGEWGVGIEIDRNVLKTEQVERVVRVLMDGEKGIGMKKKVSEWKAKAEEATKSGGSSYTNFIELVKFIGNK